MYYNSNVKPTQVSSTPFNFDLANQIFGQQGEVKIEEIDSDKKFCLGIYADGIYERRNTDVGTFVYKKHDIKTPYLSLQGQSEFVYKLPKPPKGMLFSIVEFFFSIMKKMNNSEVMVQIWWDKALEKYEIYLPVQKVSGGSIRFDHSEELQNDINKLWVLDIHSHNNMGAFFSGTDSADEVSTRVFGVIGQIKADSFSSVWRAGVNGNFHKLVLEDIWDEEDIDKDVWVIDPELVTERVSLITHNTYKMPVYAPNQVHPKWIAKANQRENGSYPQYGKHVRRNYLNGNKTYWEQQADMYSEKYWRGRTDLTDYDEGDDWVYLNGNVLDTYNKGNPNLVVEDEEDDIPSEVFIELNAINDSLEELVISEYVGEDNLQDIVDLGILFSEFIAEFKQFDESVLIAMLDQFSASMKKANFDKAIMNYME